VKERELPPAFSRLDLPTTKKIPGKGHGKSLLKKVFRLTKEKISEGGSALSFF